MKDRNSVIEDLQLNIDWIKEIPSHQFPGWGNVVIAMTDAIEQLQADGRIIECSLLRLLTLEEAYAADVVWYESRCVYDSGYGCLRAGDTKVSTIVIRLGGSSAFEDDRDYGSAWRCWSKKPTEAQRKAAIWK